MAKGTQAFELEGTYDPRTMTLNEFLTLYETESVKGGRKGNKNWGNLIRNNPVAKSYLNQPALTLFGAVPTSSETGSIMADIQNAQLKSAPTLQSKFRVIEENIFKRLQVIAKNEKLPSLLENYGPITVGVKKLKTRGGIYTARFGFDVNKIGQLVENLEKHVAKFPEDKPIANAILFNLENGSRPGLTTEIRTVHFQPSLFGEEAELMGFEKRPGLLIPAGTKGVKRQAKGQVANVQPYNAPLSKRAITILQDQSDYNSRVIGDEIKLDNYFQVTDKKSNKPRPLDLQKDVNRVLELTSPDGIIVEYTDEGTKPTKTSLKSKQLRNLYLNVAGLAIDNKVNIAMLTNRDVPENVGSQEIYMGRPGQYKSSALDDLEKVSMTNWGFFSLRSKEAKENYKKGLIRDPSELIFGDNTPNKTKNIKFVSPKDVQIQNIPMQQTGKSFEPTLEIKGTQTTKVLAPKTPQDIVSSITAEEKEKLKLLGIDVEEAFKNVKKGAKTPKGLKSIDPFAIVAGGAGISGSLDDTGELIAEEVTQSTIAQSLARTAPKLARSALGRGLSAGIAGVVIPTSAPNVDEVEGFARKDIDTRFGGIDQMDTSQEKRIFKDDPRLQGATAMYDPSELPRRDADDPLSDEAYRKRFLEKSRTKASSRLRGFAQPR